MLSLDWNYLVDSLESGASYRFGDADKTSCRILYLLSEQEIVKHLGSYDCSYIGIGFYLVESVSWGTTQCFAVTPFHSRAERCQLWHELEMIQPTIYI